MRHDERITALAAASVVAMMLPGVAVAVLYPAPPTSSPEPFLAFLALHRSALLASIFLAALGWCGALCIFAGGLLSILRRADDPNSPWPWIAFGACIATAVAIGVALTFLGIVVFRAPAIDPSLAATLYDAGGIANLMTAFPNAAYMIAAAVVIERTHVLPRWLAFGAWAVAIIHLLSATSLARAGMFAPFGLLPSLAPLSHTAWLAGISAVLLRRRA